ncbi:hypothetical protein MHYP_G00186280 [Metynnis hypsauchen]
MTRREAGQKHSGCGPRARGRCVVVAGVFDVDLDQPVEEAASEDELEDGEGSFSCSLKERGSSWKTQRGHVKLTDFGLFRMAQWPTPSVEPDM